MLHAKHSLTLGARPENFQRKAIWYGNGTKTNYSYDPLTYRLVQLQTIRLSDNEKVQELKYWYDAVGNITQMTDNAQPVVFYANTIIRPEQTYTYDALYRLIEATGRELIGNTTGQSVDNFNDSALMTNAASPFDGNALQNYTQIYEYDAVGNIKLLAHNTGSTGSYTRVFNYNPGSNRLVSADVVTATSMNYMYVHDSRGNMTEMPHLSAMDWNALNQLKHLTAANTESYYQYSGGQRLRKVTEKAGNITEERIYLGSYELYRKRIGGVIDVERSTVHIADNTGRIAMLEILNTTFNSDGAPDVLARYIYSNHLQSSGLELDETGNVISYEEYHPYGTTSYQAMSSAIKATAKRYRYTGKERDEESGLNYHGARYYAPWLCRWVSVDPLESKYAGMSSYNYCTCNPVNHTDSTGQGNDDDLKKFVEGEKQTQAQFQDKQNEVANSKADAGFKSWFAGLGVQGMVSLRDRLYAAKLQAYDTGVAVSMYGRDENGAVALPYAIKERLWGEAINETVPTLKATWAAAQSGYDENSFKDFINPFAQIAFKRALALTVSNKNEGWDLIKGVGIEVGLSWALHLVGMKGFNASVEARTIKSLETRLGSLSNPARALGKDEGVLITKSQGLQSSTNSKFNNVIIGTHGDAQTKYLWTIDNRGVNTALETTPMTTPRGNIVHTNISSKAYIGGEAWFESENTVIINAGSGRFGDGAGVSLSRWNAAIDYWKNLGYNVKAISLGSR